MTSVKLTPTVSVNSVSTFESTCSTDSHINSAPIIYDSKKQHKGSKKTSLFKKIIKGFEPQSMLIGADGKDYYFTSFKEPSR